MKVGLLNPYLRTTGMGRYAFELFDKLRNKMNNIEMTFLDFKNYGEQLPHSKGIVVKKSPLDIPIGNRIFNRFIYFNRRIYKDYDITHLANQNLSMLIPKVNNPVITCHDLLPITIPKNHSKYYVWVYKMAVKKMRLAKSIFTNSSHTKEVVVKILKIPESKITVTHYGINHSIFKPKNKEKMRKKLDLNLDKKILIHVSTEEYRKNVCGLLRAFSKLQKEDNNLKLIRIGEKGEESEKLIKKLGLEDSVFYPGVLPPEKVAEYYSAADLFVFPSFAEGFGRPPVEAMACGLPTVVANTTSLPEVVGDASILFNPYNIDEMKRKVRMILDDKSLQKKLKKKGLKWSKRFTWERCAKETLTVYEQIA